MMNGVGGGVNITADYSLAAGAEKSGGLNVTRDVASLAPGTYTYQATVDPNNKVGETNENNNTTSCQVTILARTRFPDLIITSLVLDPPAPSGTAPFKLNVTVKNQGNDLARFFQGFDVVSGDPYAGKVAEPYETTLAAGASKVYTIAPTTGGSVPGTRTWTIVLDQYNKVPESDENNNQKTISVTVK
jgi:subtilase family serine protease